MNKKKIILTMVAVVAVAVAGTYLYDHPALVRAALTGAKISFNGNELTNVGLPSTGSSVATESYVLSAGGAYSAAYVAGGHSDGVGACHPDSCLSGWTNIGTTECNMGLPTTGSNQYGTYGCNCNICALPQ